MSGAWDHYNSQTTGLPSLGHQQEQRARGSFQEDSSMSSKVVAVTHGSSFLHAVEIDECMCVKVGSAACRNRKYTFAMEFLTVF